MILYENSKMGGGGAYDLFICSVKMLKIDI